MTAECRDACRRPQGKPRGRWKGTGNPSPRFLCELERSFAESLDMKAVILAAGKGTRMKELTNEAPKPMLRVKGKPILEHILRGVVEAGVQEVFIVTGFRAEVIEDYFGDGAGWSARIVYGRQEVQDGTGKAPELARGFVGSSPFILTYGDILAGPEIYARMIRRFNEAAFAGVITVKRGQEVAQGGLNFFDEQFCLL